MECKYCEQKNETRLMTRSQLVNGTVETIDVCLECWWSKEIHVEEADGNLLSEKESAERRISNKPEPTPSSMGKRAC